MPCPVHERSTTLYVVSKWVLFPIFSVLFGMKVEGKENIPEGAAILAPNHTSYLDPPVVAYAAWPRKCCFMGKAPLFQIPVLRWYIRRAGCFPVHQNTADRQALRTALEVLKMGELLIMFPEGTRSGDGYLLEPQTGVALLAKLSGTPVVPTAVIGTREILPADPRLPRWHRLQVVFGEPMHYQRFAEQYESDRQTRDAFSHELMRRIGEMMESRGYRAFRPTAESPSPSQ
ncbi:MAG: 1-acyl-sn-glycerol-3-phosphate acyltransferase [Armatimonadota bacterium]|nr:MAG: 1-acyl-sn-glycerol-3-phosphate acyltransferase [Armatimonadota bacterium]